jgi:hypothetical protein
MSQATGHPQVKARPTPHRAGTLEGRSQKNLTVRNLGQSLPADSIHESNACSAISLPAFLR